MDHMRSFKNLGFTDSDCRHRSRPWQRRQGFSQVDRGGCSYKVPEEGAKRGCQRSQMNGEVKRGILKF